jgi:Zn-dependent peptidase ImmA (M78 family)/DNA-binding XRE family transcriptional regulator
MTTKLNPAMITIARESRGLAQSDLAPIVGISQPTAVRLEKDNANASEEVLQNLARTLRYPNSFFYRKGESQPLALSYRKRNIVAQKLMTKIEANINIYRLNMEQLLPAVGYSDIKLPNLDTLKLGSEQECAKALRKLWKLTKGPIANLAETLEQHDILLLHFDFETDRVDGRCAIVLDKFPLIVTNKALLGDRQRFTLAYQLGHLVMHQYTSPGFERDLSHEANVFAAELLMPEKDIRADLQDLTLAKLAELKKKWKVSMQALLYRASDLGLITDNQKRYLLQQFNQQNIRKREPKELDVPTESYKLVRNLLTQYRTRQKMSLPKMAAFLHLETEDFTTRYDFSTS